MVDVDIIAEVESFLADAWQAESSACQPVPAATVNEHSYGCMLEDGCYPMCTPSRMAITARPDDCVVAALAGFAVVCAAIAGLVL